MNTGAEALPEIRKDTTDRNRTSPFAFTGNKFEFRSLGSALNISCPNIMLNTMVADVLSSFSDELEKAEDIDSAVRRLSARPSSSTAASSSTATATPTSGSRKPRAEDF